MKRSTWMFLVGWGILALAFLSACRARPTAPAVVLYTSVDQVYAEPIVKQFEQQMGIQVLAVYDVEAAKTTGLVNRLIAEKGRPQADVFWSGEFTQTLWLEEQGVLAAYASPMTAGLPANFLDDDAYWTAFGGRARVILVNTERVPISAAPRALSELLDSRWEASRIGLANPLFGTTYTHAAALYAAWGADGARQYFSDLSARGVRVVDGNSVVRDLVAAGELDFGLTDTDDACGALANGAPVALVFPDQGAGQVGTLVTPNTVALVAGGPHPEQGRALIDYLLSAVVEEALVTSGWFQIPSRETSPRPTCPAELPRQIIRIPLEDIYQQLIQTKIDLTEIFLR